MLPTRWLAVALAMVTLAPRASAQDVEMLGRRHGTQPPEGYFREMARDPEAFQFTRGRAARLRAQLAEPGIAALGTGGPAAALGPRDGPVEGDVRIPVVLGLFFDSPASPPVFGPSQIAAAYFTNPAGTVSAYYDEVSGGRVNLGGDVYDWVRSDLTRDDVTLGESALLCCGIGDFIKDLIALQAGVDWGAYDNDGPDGLPNSGDDDGYVDALAVMHPTRGAECDGSTDIIWSHKWSLASASTNGQPYVTTTPSASGGSIRVDDYFVQGVLDCGDAGLNEIGVFTHETGHAFGLPDLYDTRSSPVHAGAGNWELMASGTWGCDNDDPSRPCHLSAWSKAVLGWVDVITLAPDADHGALTVAPVLTSGTVYRMNAQDGSGEYFLLENRQDLGPGTFDRNLYAEGLLVWQIDANRVQSRWASNTVNGSSRMGVWLRQADGFDDLGTRGGGRGDPGDPFPGSAGNRNFHAGTNPSARTSLGTAAGVAVLDIAPMGDDVRFRAVTGFGILAVSPLDLTVTATVAQSIQLTAQNAAAPVTWSMTGGVLPEGLSFGADGRITGSALDLGAFSLDVEATDAVGLSAVATVALEVDPPVILIGQLASRFLLRGAPLGAVEEAFLDRQGNFDGAYDLGDFRAWVLANPSLPLSADLARLVGAR